MKFLTIAVTALAGTAALSVCASHAAAPKPDLNNLPAYFHALNNSTDPESIAIRKEIADGPAALAKARAQALAAGMILSTAQFQQPLPPDGDNAAPLYQQLTDLRRQKPLNLPLYAQPLGYRYAYTLAQIATVEQIVDSRPDVFALLNKAAARPDNVIRYNWSQQPFMNPFPIFASYREYARELVTESHVRVTQGRYREAVADQALGFQVARDVSSPPMLISELVAYAIDGITLSGMQGILETVGPNAAVDTQVENLVQEDFQLPTVGQALQGETAVGLSFLEYSRTMISTMPNSVETHSSSKGSGPQLSPADARTANDMIDAAEAAYLQFMAKLVAASADPPLARRAQFAKIAVPSPGHDLVKQLYTDFVRSCTNPQFLLKDDQIHAEQATIIASAAALAVKAKTGVFPAALPGNFKDPFSGKPLGYRREGTDGFVIYSVGPDGKFDGGKPGEYKFNPYDTLFRYPGPKPQPLLAYMLK